MTSNLKLKWALLGIVIWALVGCAFFGIYFYLNPPPDLVKYNRINREDSIESGVYDVLFNLKGYSGYFNVVHCTLNNEQRITLCVSGAAINKDPEKFLYNTVKRHVLIFKEAHSDTLHVISVQGDTTTFIIEGQ